jgi:hypothetical protein
VIVTTVVPEWAVELAARCLKDAIYSCKIFKHLATLDGVEWTLVHGFCGNMGGFAMKIILSPEGASIPDVAFHLSSKTSTQSSEEIPYQEVATN